MYMVELNDLLPAEQWERNWTILGDQHEGLPHHAEYVIFEYYCTSKGCDCRTLIASIQKLDSSGEPVQKPSAVISYDWSSEEKACNPELHESSPRTPLASNLLETYKKHVHHSEYVERITRQYAKVKDLACRQKAISISGLSGVVGGQKTGRNEPCLCGSRKKYKKCCMKN